MKILGFFILFISTSYILPTWGLASDSSGGQIFRPPEKSSPSSPSPSVTTIERPTRERRHGVGIGLGQTFLLGEFETLGDNAINLDFFYSYLASYSFDFLLNFHHSTHTFKSTRVVIHGFAPGIKAKLYQFDSFSPFLLGGFGFYRPRTTRYVEFLGYQESRPKTTFGAHIGFGGDLKLNEFVTMGLLGQYHHPINIKQEVGPKVSGSYFKLLVTAMVTF